MTKPLCYSPWTNLDISPSGYISPCCKFIKDQSTEKHHIKQHTIDQYINSDFLQDLKRQMLQGEWPLGCERCRIEEQNNIASKRELDNERWNNYYAQYDLDTRMFITASIAFGNTCNLKCITCGPLSSSKWQKEYLALHGKNVKPLHFYRADFVDEFIDYCPQILHLDIPGGEPFLSGVYEQQRLLSSLIEQGRSHEISLHYTTNGTVFPDQTWWALWNHFKEIDLQLSIDDTGHRFEYIRHHAIWHDVLKNITEYQHKDQTIDNFRISVSCTVSAYNVAYLPEFFDWCQEKQLPRPWLGKVHNPTYMRPGVWGGDAKQYIIDRLLQHDNPDCHDWAKLLQGSNDEKYFDEFVQKLKWHDTYRGLSFKDTFPEMSAFI